MILLVLKILFIPQTRVQLFEGKSETRARAGGDFKIGFKNALIFTRNAM
jgi:hypothetical protein